MSMAPAQKAPKTRISAGWTPLAIYDRRISIRFADIFERRKPMSGSSVPMGVGYLNWFAKTQAQK